MTLRALPAVLVLGLGCAQSRSSEGPAGPKPGIEPIPMPVQEQPAISYRVTGTTKYALHRRDSVTVQLPSGPTQAQIWGRTVYLRTTVEPAGAGATERRIEVVIDSIVLDQDVDFPKVMLDSATGTRWTGWFLPTGRLEDLVASKSSLVGEQIRNQLRLFFPVLPANGANLGSEWSDSTTSPVKVSAFEATEQALSRYRVAGFDIHAGTDVIRIDAARTSGLAASGSQFGRLTRSSFSTSCPSIWVRRRLYPPAR